MRSIINWRPLEEIKTEIIFNGIPMDEVENILDLRRNIPSRFTGLRNKYNSRNCYQHRIIFLQK